jgi:DNA-binding NtrC family response regulator
MKMGATDFLTKPIQNARLDVSARNALKMSIMGHEISRLKRQTNGETKFTDLIGHNRGLNHSVQIGIKAAANTLPVLITGETGTGKEVFARAIHGESKRSGQNFIAVNCGAIPEKLVESTLFGHEKGAFTGATEKALGKFQEASGGTIFLDEVGELPLEAQVKLLRVLQQNEVEPVGGGKPIPINVRVISATNRNLSQDVERGLFREDLFFRLNVLHVNLPPLRNRKEDIPQIVEHFIEKFCAANHEIHKMISEDAMQKMINHNWPGNVRELENIIYRTMALCDEETISADHINFIQIVSDQNTSAYNKTINSLNDDGKFKSFKTLEQEIITLALKHHDGNITQTARSLGIAKSTLYSKIETLADQKSA